jgi:CRP-like cAMP-binding protein
MGMSPKDSRKERRIMQPVFNLHNFYDGLPLSVRAEFDNVSRYRNLEEGAVVVRTGDRRESLHQLLEGQVKYCSYDRAGRETVSAMMKPGDWIGLSEVFAGIPALVDAIATTPARLRTIARSDFEALLDRHPIIARELLRLFSLRFSIMYRTAQDHHQLTLEERLVKLLHLLSFEAGAGERSGQGVVIRASQEDLAKMLAASRQTLNRLLRQLEKDGLVQLGYRSIILPDLHRIERKYVHLLGRGDLTDS